MLWEHVFVKPEKPAPREAGRGSLPEPMLARADRLPQGDFAFEVKWDGFRALVSTEEELEVRSRRGWNMSERVPELARLPSGLLLDGELISLGEDGRPSFPRLGLRVLHGRASIPILFVVFDLLRVEEEDVMLLPYAQRRTLLEELELNGPAWRTPEVFHDGEALLEATGNLGLEGIVAKKRSEPYRPGERCWIKVKHRHYWRFRSGLGRRFG
jgi:bifunctional non-homologous end joining protein LigD